MMPPFGNGTSDMSPKCWRMVEFEQMAELVGDEIVGQMRRQMYDPIIKIEIAIFRTTAPSRSLVADGDFLNR